MKKTTKFSKMLLSLFLVFTLLATTAGSVFAEQAATPAPKTSNPTRGIDVSMYQGIIDWKKVKKSGKVQFALIRALCWNRAKNNYMIDPYFDKNVRAAKANGIKVGVYLYSYAFSKAEMAQEVRFFARSHVVKQHAKEGIVYDMPVFIDYEDKLILENTKTKKERTENLRYGMKQLEKYNFTPGFYSNLSWAQYHYDAKALLREGYDFWLAKPGNHSVNKTHSQHGWSGPPLTFWQYSFYGKVAGIRGNVDLNWCYKYYKFTPLRKKSKT